MLRIMDKAGLVGKQVALVFKTTHIDKAGETSAYSVTAAEVVAIDITGEALLVTDNDLHFRFPAACFHALPKAKSRRPVRLRNLQASFVGGQEIIRDFHNAIEPVRLQWLDWDRLVSLLNSP